MWAFVGLACIYVLVYCYAMIVVCTGQWLQYDYVEGILNICLTILLLAMFLISYLRAALTKPGYIEKGSEKVEEEGKEDDPMWCPRCHVEKPLRAHHCRRCNHCVLKMDHHCHWINNCVGLRNHKFFFLTVLYAWLGQIYVDVMVVLRLLGTLPEKYLPFARNYPLYWWDMVVLALCVLVALLNTPSLTYMLSFHIYLISKNRTNVEHVCCKGVLPACNFDRKSIVANWYDCMGRDVWFWWLPIAPDNQHTGYDFLSEADYSSETDGEEKPLIGDATHAPQDVSAASTLFYVAVAEDTEERQHDVDDRDL